MIKKFIQILINFFRSTKTTKKDGSVKLDDYYKEYIKEGELVLNNETTINNEQNKNSSNYQIFYSK